MLLLILMGCGPTETAVSPSEPSALPTPDLTLTAPQLLWQTAVLDGLTSPPVLAGGKVVVATDTAVVAYAPDAGQELWRVAPDGGVWSRSLAADENAVFVGTPGGVLALRLSDGQLIWQQPLEGELIWPPLAAVGRLYVATAFVGPGLLPQADGKAWVYALDATSGRVEWSVKTVAYALITPASNQDLLFVGGSWLSEDAVAEGGHLRLHAYNKETGMLVWSADREDGFLKSLAADDAHLYFLAYTDMVYALDAAAGSETWRYPTENWSPGFRLYAGALYFGSDNAFVHAVDGQSGTAVWRAQLEGIFNAPRSTPVVEGKALYFQGNDNRLYCLSRETGEVCWQTEPQARSRVPLVVGDGRLFLLGQDGVLYAFAAP
ncbi:MAG: PQQ-binding-like beta-propeller repeat protein [Chloroflexi bacterium]|nr:PQQ-binding-like beta-propeller repeat protein [Chloroflexota bacterium]MBP7042622.1 PQQ-binding-like beta-propeller repeat protein [Chloroflexota bacterium]